MSFSPVRFMCCIILLLLPGPLGAQASMERSFMTELRSARLSGVIDVDGPVQLVHGEWKGRPFIQGSAERPSVRLVEDLVVTGNVNGDDSDDAVAFIRSSGGGSGTQVSAAFFLRKDSSLKNIATVGLGDRTQVRTASIDSDGEIAVILVRMGNGDALCCPGEMVKRRWKWKNGSLHELPEVPLGRFSTASLEETVWRLESWKNGEQVDTNTAVTIRFSGERVSGRSACNQYFAQCKNGAGPGMISISAGGSTKMMCSPELMATEDRFLRLLPHVDHVQFSFGRLLMEYEGRGVRGTLIFISNNENR